VRHQFAIKLGLKVWDYSVYGKLSKLGIEESRHTTVYLLKLVDREGKEQNILAYALDVMTIHN
jgi:hypothetical protein